ncbi:hypothetical protein V8F06_011616 [Rhypophila decipiens]
MGLQKEELFANGRHGFLSFIGLGLEKQEISKESLIYFTLEDSTPRQSRFVTNKGDTKGAVYLALIVTSLLMGFLYFGLDPTTSYNVLTFMIAYTSIIVPGMVVSWSLLYLKAMSWSRRSVYEFLSFLGDPIYYLSSSWVSRPFEPPQSHDELEAKVTQGLQHKISYTQPNAKHSRRASKTNSSLTEIPSISKWNLRTPAGLMLLVLFAIGSGVVTVLGMFRSSNVSAQSEPRAAFENLGLHGENAIHGPSLEAVLGIVMGLVCMVLGIITALIAWMTVVNQERFGKDISTFPYRY